MDPKITVTSIKEMDEYAEKYAANIDGQEFEFTGRYYDRLDDPSNWQYGVCSVCGNVSGRSSVGGTDILFCLEHREIWEGGYNSLSDYKEVWYTKDIKEQNVRFLEAVGRGQIRN